MAPLLFQVEYGMAVKSVSFSLPASRTSLAFPLVQRLRLTSSYQTLLEMLNFREYICLAHAGRVGRALPNRR